MRPLGYRTGNVEGLTSYIKRLAQEYDVSPRILIELEVVPLLRDRGLNVTSYSTVGNLWELQGLHLNGNGHSAHIWTDVFEELTGRQDLRFSTLLTWRAIATTGLLRKRPAWCPMCYQSWHDQKQPLYEPLCWSIAAFTVCPEHQRPLEHTCPHPSCRRAQRLVARRHSTGHCVYCNGWLGSKESASVLSDQSYHDERWTMLAIHELILEAPNQPSPPSQATLVTALNGIASQVGGLTALGRLTGDPGDGSTQRWLTGQIAPSLPSLLRLSRALGTSPSRLLRGDILSGAMVNQLAPPRSIRSRSWRTGFAQVDAAEVRRIVDEWLAKDEMPPPIHHLAEQIGWPVHILITHCKDDWDRYIARRRAIAAIIGRTGTKSRPQAIQRLQEALTANDPTTTVASVARDVGWSSRHLKKVFPDECQQLVTRHRELANGRSCAAHQVDREEVRRVCHMLHEAGVRPSLHRADRELPSRISLAKPRNNQTWQDVLKELGYG